MTKVDEAKMAHDEAVERLHEAEAAVTDVERMYLHNPHVMNLKAVYSDLWKAQGEVARLGVNITWAYQDQATADHLKAMAF